MSSGAPFVTLAELELLPAGRGADEDSLRDERIQLSGANSPEAQCH
jgi:hypothetical protein